MTRPILPATLILSLVALLVPSWASAQITESWTADASRSGVWRFERGVLDLDGPLASAALRQASRLAAQHGPGVPLAERGPRHGWIHRHPVWFSTLLGAAAGEAWAVADAATADPHYWGEAVVMGGLLGAGVGALVGVIWDGVRK